MQHVPFSPADLVISRVPVSLENAFELPQEPLRSIELHKLCNPIAQTFLSRELPLQPDVDREAKVMQYRPRGAGANSEGVVFMKFEPLQRLGNTKFQKIVNELMLG